MHNLFRVNSKGSNDHHNRVYRGEGGNLAPLLGKTPTPSQAQSKIKTRSRTDERSESEKRPKTQGDARQTSDPFTDDKSACGLVPVDVKTKKVLIC